MTKHPRDPNAYAGPLSADRTVKTERREGRLAWASILLFCSYGIRSARGCNGAVPCLTNPEGLRGDSILPAVSRFGAVAASPKSAQRRSAQSDWQDASQQRHAA